MGTEFGMGGPILAARIGLGGPFLAANRFFITVLPFIWEAFREGSHDTYHIKLGEKIASLHETRSCCSKKRLSTAPWCFLLSFIS